MEIHPVPLFLPDSLEDSLGVSLSVSLGVSLEDSLGVSLGGDLKNSGLGLETHSHIKDHINTPIHSS